MIDPHGRRAGVGARLHRRGRSGAHVWQRRTEASGSCRSWPAAKRLGAFALTEPCAGSDLTALRTTARREGDEYVVNGEKLFITNVVPGRTIGLVCLIDEQAGRADRRSAARRRTNSFSFARVWPVRAASTRTTRASCSTDLRVPAENLLTPPRGDGLTIAYHGLNSGRVALCANAAGTMRLMLASMMPWAKFRRDLRRGDREARTGAAAARRTGRPDRRLRRAGGVVLGLLDRAIAARWNASSPRSSAANRRRKPPSSCS